MKQLDIDLFSFPVFFLDKEFYILELNQPFADLLKLQRKDVYKTPVSEQISDFPFHINGVDILSFLKLNKVCFFDTTINRKEKAYKYPCKIGLLYVVSEGIEYVVGFVTDMLSDHKSAKESREVSILLEAMFNAIKDPIEIKDRDMKVLYLNEEAAHYFDRPLEDIIGNKCFKIRGFDTKCDDCAVSEVFETGKSSYKLQYQEEQQQWWEIRAYPIFDENGDVYRVIEHLRDITSKVEAEAELKRAYDELLVSEKENRLSMFVIDRAGEGVYLVDSNGVIKRANDQLCLMWGYQREEIAGKHISIVNPRLKKNSWKKRWNQFVEEKTKTIEDIHVNKDGKEMMVEINLNYLEFDHECYVVGFVRDITERKRSEQRLKNALAEIELLKNRLLEENLYLQGEIKLDHNFDEIITQNQSLKKILSYVERVASTNSTVLITGETGTGKELLARAIHNISGRSKRPLVKVNCAALPESLIESELFGYEKGAFTGALQRKIGRFELADKGTIFLDEIGEIPVALQSKLLRVLQDGEFERLGNPNTIKVDVRVIAATNRDLTEEIKKKNFRSDLFYRLNVFPVEILPLRERKEDIPLLVNHFIVKHSSRLGKHIEAIPHKTMAALQKYNWPGNVRELENLIERYMITSKSNFLEISDFYLDHKVSDEGSVITSLEENERKHILTVLEKTGYRIRGEDGAAEILNIKPTTLEARMKKLGVIRK